jgi:hypothetical protein
VPEVSRRAVMATALGGLGLAAVLPAAPAFARTESAAGSAGRAAVAASGSSSAPVDPVRSLFADAIGRPFRAVDGDRTLDLVLRAVEDLSADSAGDENRFLLLFAADGYGWADGIYTVRRAGSPDVLLFLSPIGRGGLTRTVQAVVNRTA